MGGDRKRRFNERLFHQAVGERIRELRREKGIKQVTLAKKLGVTATMMTRYEKGIAAISFLRLLRAAAILQVPLAEIVREAIRKV